MKPRSSEELIEALRALEREEAGDALADARWERLAAGTASAEDLAEIERAAGDDALVRELFEPLGPAAEERYATAIEAEIKAQRQAKPPAPPRAPAPVIPLSRRRGARLAALSAALAMAAALALVLRAPPRVQELPTYELGFAGGEELQRGEPTVDRPRIARGSRLVITLRPTTPAAGPLEARVFLVQAGKVTPLEVAVRVSPDGALRLSGSVDPAAPIVPGDAEIVAVVGRPGAFPQGEAPGLGEGEGRRVLRRAVRVIELP